VKYLARPDQEVDGQCHYDENWDGNTPLHKVLIDMRNYVDIVRYLVRVNQGCSLRGEWGGRKKGRKEGRDITHGYTFVNDHEVIVYVGHKCRKGEELE